MKKLLPLAACIILGASTYLSAQTPEAFKYQASLRNSQGEIITDRLVSIRVSILTGSDAQSGTEMYSEIHTVSTNKLGLVNFEIGHGKTVSGNFAAINWENSKNFVRIEMDENGGNNYKVLGISQLLSVPYSLHAKMASDVMPGSITIQNEIAARQAADKDLQAQINMMRGLLESGSKGGSLDNILGIPQDLEALRNRYMADSSAKNTRINNNLTRFTNDSVAVRNLITTETNRATDAENNLQTQVTNLSNSSASALAAEVSRAQAAEADLQAQISAEAARAQSTENTISTNLAGETARAQAAEAALTGRADAIEAAHASTNAAQAATNSSLQNAIATEAARAQAAEQANAANLTAETARATTAEQTLATEIATASSNAAAATTGVQNNLNAEVARAQAAEQQNATAIANEAARAINAESDLQNAITSEAQMARAAEAALSSRVNTLEATATAQTGINADLQNAISVETSRATAAEQVNAAAITAETARAQAAEATLASDISAAQSAITSETARAQAAEATLASDISAAQSAIAAETARAQAAEATLASDISAAQSAITSETARAQAAEATLASDISAAQSAIAAETARAQAAEQANAAAITNEAATARAAEQQNASDIAAEAGRAQAAESGLNTRVSALEAATTAQAGTNSNIQNAIAAETNRAQAAEQANATAITAEANRAQNAENGIQTQVTNNLTRFINDSTAKNAAIASKWGNTGNAGTNPSTNFIGTTDNVDFVAKTNNAERLRITSSGQVEINTTTGSLLLPRLTTAQRDALTAAPGMVIFNTTTGKFQGYGNGSGTGSGVETLDQNYQGTYSNLSANTAAQSFTAGVTGSLTKVAIYTTQASSGNSSYTLNIRSGSGQTGSILGSQSVTLNNTTGEQSFSISGVSITAGSQYTIEFVRTSGNYPYINYVYNSTYSGGQMYLNNNGYNYYQYDIPFKTFVTTGGGSNSETTGWQDMPGASAGALAASETGLQTQINTNLARFRNDSTAVRGLITSETNRAVGIENGLRTDVNSAASVANSANNLANTANNNANSAYNMASSAQSQASSAQSQASSAQSQASSAQSQASSAYNMASSAQSQASSAYNMASSAQSQASSAYNMASSAQSQASSAYNTAGSALNSANNATSVNNTQASDIANLQAQVGSGTVDSRIAASAASIWSKAGNAASSADFIGTTNAQDFVTKTNNAERIRVTSAGKVKISGPVEVNTTSGGFILPRITTAQRDALAAEAGMTVYNTTLSKFQGYVSSQGTQALDQSQTAWPYQNSFYNVGQTFVAGATGLLSKIEINIWSFSSAGACTLKVYSGSGANEANLLATVTSTITSNGVKSFDLSGVNVESGNTYTFRVANSAACYILVAPGNSYSSGHWVDNNGNVDSSYDLKFATYVTPVTGGWVDLH